MTLAITHINAHHPMQVRLNDSLGEENSMLAERYNSQAKLVEQLQTKVGVFLSGCSMHDEIL